MEYAKDMYYVLYLQYRTSNHLEDTLLKVYSHERVRMLDILNMLQENNTSASVS